MTVCYSEVNQHVGQIVTLLRNAGVLEREMGMAYPNRLLL